MALHLHTSPIYGTLFGDPELETVLDDRRALREMVRFEAALARVEGRLGLIPDGEGLSHALAEIELDPNQLGAGTAAAGVPVPALVAALRQQVPPDVARWLHWGATSQDVIDTAHVLQYGACLDILAARVSALIDRLDAQSLSHADTVMAGRTRGQIATPISFGLRIAQWAHPLIDAEADLETVRARLGRVQFGGAAGANTAVAPHGPAIAQGLAEELGLRFSPPWHTNRTGPIGFAAWLGSVTAALGKIARDVILLSRSEIAEARAGSGGGSSTMPQKANPVLAEAIVTLSHLAQTAQAGLAAAASPAEERDGSAWAVEWALIPQAVLATGAALRHALSLAETLTADADAMARTLAAADGVMAEAASFVLARHMPRDAAQQLVKQALADDRPLAQALAARTDLEIDWDQALDPRTVVDACVQVRDQVFGARRAGAP